MSKLNDDMSDYQKFIERENKKFFEHWLEQAQTGNGVAIYTVAECFYNGMGTPKNIEEAARWYRLVANAGNFVAQAKLNEMFAKGEISEPFTPTPFYTSQPKTSTPSFFNRNKKSSNKPSKKSYDGSFSDVDAGLSALFNDEKAGYEEKTYHFKESYDKKKYSKSKSFFDADDDSNGDDY